MDQIPEDRLAVNDGLGIGAYVAVSWGIWNGVKVSLKTIKIEDDEDVGAFIQEIQGLGALYHPNILATWGTCQRADGSLLLVMEFTDRCTLSQRVAAEGGPLPIEETVFYLSSLARAVEYAHGKGIVHNDINGENALLSVASGALVVKLTGFGVATSIQRALPKTFAALAAGSRDGSLVASNYTAPENLDAENAAFGKVRVGYSRPLSTSVPSILAGRGCGGPCICLPAAAVTRPCTS